jgi:hypothetical protein
MRAVDLEFCSAQSLARRPGLLDNAYFVSHSCLMQFNGLEVNVPSVVCFADTLSMVLLALNCIMHDHRNRNLDEYVKKPSTRLAEAQRADGSFGNLRSTALAIQVCLQHFIDVAKSVVTASLQRSLCCR